MFHNGAKNFEDTFLNQIQFNFKILNNFTRSSINFAFPKKIVKNASCDFTENLAPLCVFSSFLTASSRLLKVFTYEICARWGFAHPRFSGHLILCKNLIKIWKIQARGKKLLNGAVSYIEEAADLVIFSLLWRQGRLHQNDECPENPSLCN